MRAGLELEVEQGKDGQCRAEQVGDAERGDFGDISAGEHPDSDTYVPRGQVRAGGRSTLGVRCQVDEKGVVGRKHGTEPDAQQQGDGEEQYGGERHAPADQPSARAQAEIAETHQIETCLNHSRHHSLVYQFPAEQPADGHSYGHEGEEEAGFRRKPDLLGIHGHVVGGHAVGDGEQEQAESGRNPFQEDEPVQRDGFPFHRRTVAGLHHAGGQESQDARSQGVGEDGDVGDSRAMQEQAEHRTDGHGDVVRQAVISQSLSTPGGGHDVDDYRVSAYRHHAERDAVKDAQEDEQGEQSCHHVSGKYQGKDEVGEQV